MNETIYRLEAVEPLAVYPGAGSRSTTAINYTILGLIGEAGEIANNWKKTFRDDNGQLTQERYEELVDELGDVYWYLVALASELNIPLSELRERNAAKLFKRKSNGSIHGHKRAA